MTMKNSKLGDASMVAEDMNEEQLRSELHKARKATEAANSSKIGWIMFLLLFGCLFGAW